MRRNSLSLFSLFLAGLFLLAACHSDNDGGRTGGDSVKASADGKTVAGGAPAPALNDEDRRRAQAAAQSAYVAQIGQRIFWDNPGDGHSGLVVPLRDGYTASGAYCREFQQTLNLDGQKQQSYSKACQQRDGSWQTVQ